MKIALPDYPIFRQLKNRSIPFIKENGKIVTQFILTLLFIALAIWFIRHEKTELRDVRDLLAASRWQVVLAGACLTIIYIVLQGLMYKAAFASLQARVPLLSTIILFLKRNFISVFLPAGGVSSLVFFQDDIVKKGVSKTQVQLASSIYAFTGILSIIVLAVPAFTYAILRKSIDAGEIYSLVAIVILLGLIYMGYRSVRSRGIVHRMLVRYLPVTEVFLEDLGSRRIRARYFIAGLLASICIEITGIALLYVAMLAIGGNPSVITAILGYIVAVVMMVASPFLRGLGAVEVSMSFILIRSGYTNVEAITITLLYRFFEFWLTLFIGLLSFLVKINRLLLRIIPTLLILALGIINIISVMTPAIASRVARLQDFLPLDAINASNILVLAAGLFMLITAAFLLKGLRSAWWFALMLSALSFIGHLTKAIDYEEALVAFLVMAVLIATRKDYYIRTSPKLRSVGIQTALLATLAVMVYGIVGFYFLDKKHFGIDFSFWQSVRYTLQNYFLVESPVLNPMDRFAHRFLLSINASGVISMGFLVYTLIRPYVFKDSHSPEDLARAKSMVSHYGLSGLDYFKTYRDKQLFLPVGVEAFVAYRVTGSYAVVLEDPVAPGKDQVKSAIVAFDRYCYEHGLKSIWYRVPEESLGIYNELKKKYLLLGQEGVIDLESFNLEGADRKDLRHAVNKFRDSGFNTTIHVPPIKDGTLQKLKSVSDEWLTTTGRKEIVFSQGAFDWDELKQQEIITVENPGEKIVAFLNIIPDHAPGEGTYDLLRKTTDAPNRTSEFLVIRLCEYLSSNGYRYVNLGFAPLSGIDDPRTFPERSMRFAYERIRSFSHYKGMREFKERFSPEWHNKYLVYENDFDLIQVPGVLSSVIKP